MSSRWPAGIIRKNPVTPAGPAGDGAASGVWTLSEAMYWQKQGLWPIPGYVPPDPYFPYVTMLLSTTSLGNANNNLFVDSSGAFNPISRNGNATQGSFTPYSSNWSNYFDGSSTLTFSQINMAGDFTIEGWVYFIGTNSPTVLGANPPNHQSLRRLNSGKHYFYREGVDITGTIDVPLNQWVHLAATRSSGTVRIFTNGVLDGSRTITGTFSLFCLGGVDTVNDRLTGYTSNMRVVNGTALYTATFTPPTAPLTAVSGTALLTSQSNRFRDASSNNLTFTVNGSPRVTDFAPFSPASPGITYNQSDITNWSGYFDGSGDYLSIPNNAAFSFGNGDFCIEMWAYKTLNANSTIFSIVGVLGLIFYNNNRLGVNPSGVGTPIIIDPDDFPLNAWTHVACTREGSTLRLFINGALKASGTSTTNYTATGSTYIGLWTDGSNFPWNGYISNVRVVKGTAVYTSAFTPPTTNLTAISGTSLLTLQNAAFTDNSTNNFVVTPNGNTTVTGNSPFNTVGYWSNYFSGSGTYLSIPSNAAFAFGTGDFTVEGWIFVTVGSLTQRIVWFSDDRVNIDINSSNQIYFTTTNSINSQTFGTVTLNTWVHFAVSRTSGTVSAYLDGVRGYTGSYTSSMSNRTMYLGVNGNGNGFFNGYMSNIRMLKGTGLYSGATITVPTAPLTAIANTSLLTCQNARIVDNSTNALSFAVANASVQSFDPFYTSTIASNGGSMYFDGSGDYLLTPYSGNTIFGSANFTFEAWIYPTTTSSTCTVAALNNTTSGGAYCAVRIDYTGSTQSASMLISNAANSWQIISGTSSNVVRANSWSHIAVVRNGSSFTLYVNGVSSATGTYSGSINSYGAGDYIGAVWNGSAIEQPFFGYISNLRLVKGTAVYTSAFTPPTAPVTPTPATTLLVNGMNAGIYDATAINDMETVGNAQVTTAVSKFGGSSVYFDGTGDYLTSNAASDLYAFGTGDFTVEMWFNLSSFANLQVLYDSRPTSTDGLYVCIFVPAGGASVNLQVSAATQITGTATLSTGVWYHLALSRSSGSTKMFLNGTQVGSTYADTNAYLNSGTTRPFIGGSSYSAGTLTVNGYIDEVRVTKGVARYTSNFTPPTKAFPAY